MKYEESFIFQVSIKEESGKDLRKSFKMKLGG